MRRTWGWLVIALAAGCAGGCKASGEQSGFLSDYSRLGEEVSDGRIYVALDNRIAGYNKFLFDPVEVRAETPSEHTAELAAYATVQFGGAVRDATGRYVTAQIAGPGVARIRIAITTSDPEGLQRGTAVLEAEVLDSQTGEQLVAAVLAQRTVMFSLGQFEMRGAMAAVDDWAERFGARLKEAYAARR